MLFKHYKTTQVSSIHSQDHHLRLQLLYDYEFLEIYYDLDFLDVHSETISPTLLSASFSNLVFIQIVGLEGFEGAAAVQHMRNWVELEALVFVKNYEPPLMIKIFHVLQEGWD